MPDGSHKACRNRINSTGRWSRTRDGRSRSYGSRGAITVEVEHGAAGEAARRFHQAAPKRAAKKGPSEMRQITGAMAALILTASLTVASHAQSGGVERLYILNCGEGQAGDISRW